MAKAVEQLQKSLQQELDAYKATNKDFQKAVAKRQQIDAQLNENNMVQSELELLKDDAEVYKLIGPVLILQQPIEAKENVKKRVEYIKGELKRLDTSIAALDKKQYSQRETLTNLQKNLQEAQQKAAN